MKRDGAATSLWQNGMEDYRSKPVDIAGRRFDVAIVGGGVTGITAALELQKRGLKVLVAEAQTLCFGTTGGTTAHLNTFLDTDYEQIRSNFGEDAIHLVAGATARALELYRTNTEQYGINCGYVQKDGYLYAQTPEQAEQLDKIYETSKLAGVDLSYTDRIPVPLPFQKAIVYREQAQLHPARYVHALARAFEEGGGVIAQQCFVEEVVEGEGMVAVQTSQGSLKATYLIYATHIPPGINLLHFRCAPYRSYAIAVKLRNGAYPDALSYDMYDPYHYYRTQEIDGEQYFIAGGEDHKTAHEKNTEACLQRLEAHVRAHFDVEKTAFRWSSQYFEPGDGLAYIGLLPGSSGNILVATGYGGNGMTYSHIAAPLLADLITHKENAYAALFSPNRIKPIAGFAAFVKENADVVKEFVGRRFAAETLHELADLAPGEARLVKFEGKKLAIYKDDSGRLFAVNPVCTHAKCIVDWNGTEKTWDCPCHGARYAVTGEVLTGPARKALEVVPLEQLIGKE